MLRREFTLKWRFGLRTAMLVHTAASRHGSSVELSWNGQRADAKDLIALVCMGASRPGLIDSSAMGPNHGDVITVSANGEDAEATLADLADLFVFGDSVTRCLHPECPSTPILSGFDARRAEYSCGKLHLWIVERETGKVVVS